MAVTFVSGVPSMETTTRFIGASGERARGAMLLGSVLTIATQISPQRSSPWRKGEL
jgi:hypothetical protein